MVSSTVYNSVNTCESSRDSGNLPLSFPHHHTDLHGLECMREEKELVMEGGRRGKVGGRDASCLIFVFCLRLLSLPLKRLAA